MYVTQLLYPLALAPNIEVIETLLPYLHRFPKRRLRRPNLSFRVQPAAKSFFDHFHYDRRITHFRLRNQHMEMLRHNHIAHNHEPELASCLFEKFKEQVAAFTGTQLRLSPVATAGDEVKVVGTVVAM